MKKVLLIEDDVVLRENIAEILELSNYEMIIAPNGEVGLELATKEIPDIIICDVIMPKLNGYAVLEMLSKNDITKNIPFIFLSAKTSHQDIRKGMNLGADDYITKPFSEDDLISAIESRVAKANILKDERVILKNSFITDENETKPINDLKHFFDEQGEILTCNKDSIIYTEGHPSNFIYFILKGVVKCYKLDEQGKELTTGLHKENDLFGYTSFTQNNSYRETARTIKKVKLARIAKSVVKNILENNYQLTFELLELLTNNITGIKDQLLQMAYSSVHKKTAKTILKFAEKLNKQPEDPIKISRGDLASVAGIATETLIRAITNFKKQGLIEIEGRNIKIVDIESLKKI